MKSIASLKQSSLGTWVSANRAHLILCLIYLTLTALLLLVPSELMAQWTQSDGSTFGKGPNGQEYFNFIVKDAAFNSSMCTVARITRWFIVGLSLIYAFWMGYRAAQGAGQEWKKAAMYIIVAGIMAAPATFFGKAGILWIGPVADFISTCKL